MYCEDVRGSEAKAETACPIPYKQGESIFVEIKITEDDGLAIENLASCGIVILVSSAYADMLAFGRNTDKEVLPVELDEDGVVAFKIDAEQTKSMRGEYFLEMAIEQDGTRVVTDPAFIFEIEESRVSQME